MEYVTPGPCACRRDRNHHQKDKVMEYVTSGPSACRRDRNHHQKDKVMEYVTPGPSACQRDRNHHQKVMIFFGTYTNYSLRANLSISIISMTKTKEVFIPECKESSLNGSTPKHSDSYPDYGPRYDWNQITQGFILSSYFYGFVACGLPSGALSEWVGPSPIIFWMTLASAILNSLCVPAVWVDYYILMALRFCIGSLGAFTYPALQTLIAKWAPPLEKGRFTAGLMGSSLATVLNWPLISVCTVRFGWDWGFHVISVILLVYCVVFWFVVTDSPENHKFISKEELEYILTSQGESVTNKKHTPPYFSIMKSLPFWILVISNFGSLWGLFLQFYSIPKYLAEVIGYDLKDTGILGMLPHLCRLIIGIIIGPFADWLEKRNFATKKGIRTSFTTFSHCLPGLLLIGIPFCGCNASAILCLLVASLGLNGVSSVTNLVNCQDLAPNFAGTIYGLMSFVGAFAGIVVPKVTGVCIQVHNGVKEWGIPFYIGGIMYIVSGLVFILFASVKEQEWNRIPDT